MKASTAYEASRAEIESLGPWFHNLHLPGGMQTAPDHVLGDFPSVKWRQIEPFMAADLRGQRVLDIGCNAGFYSFELARRGADVLAIDIDPHYLRQARWAARQFDVHARIEFRTASVYDLQDGRERFDIVWFLGVLYHLRHPLLALDILREITGRQLVLQTMTMPGEGAAGPAPSIGLAEREQLSRPSWPCMAFIEGELADDPTNWWAPNPACVEALVRAAGFTVIGRPGHEIYFCEPNPAEPPVMRHLRQLELRAVTRQSGAGSTPQRGAS
jgi:tRNA (mo5U34)-methyltransferase